MNRKSAKDKVENLPVDQSEIVSKLVTQGDLSGLSPVQKVQYYNAICERLGLDPLTQPFKILYLSGKQVLYCDRGGAQQLNKLYKVSHRIVARDVVQSCYVVTAQASLPEGQQTESIGAVPLTYPETRKEDKKTVKHPKANQPLVGEDLCNAFMKAETKAKRRSTLDLLGLGMLDETELSSIPEAEVLPAPIEVNQVMPVQNKEQEKEQTSPPEEPPPAPPEDTQEDPVNPEVPEEPEKDPVITEEQSSTIQTLLENPVFTADEKEKGLAFLSGNPSQARAVKFIDRLKSLIAERAPAPAAPDSSNQVKPEKSDEPWRGNRLAHNGPPDDYGKGPMSEEQKNQIAALVKKHRIKKAEKQELIDFSRKGTGWALDSTFKAKEKGWASYFIEDFEKIYQNYQDEKVRANAIKNNEIDSLNRLLNYYKIPDNDRARFFEFALSETNMEDGPEFRQMLIEHFMEFLDAFQNAA